MFQKDGWFIGHSGYGDQYVAVDTKHDLAFAYVSNALKAGVKDSAIVSKKLINSIYSVLWFFRKNNRIFIDWLMLFFKQIHKKQIHFALTVDINTEHHAGIGNF